MAIVKMNHKNAFLKCPWFKRRKCDCQVTAGKETVCAKADNEVSSGAVMGHKICERITLHSSDKLKGRDMHARLLKKRLH